ncbi:MAG: hypothetical protein Q8N39_05295 [Pelolinea sp.]|nr:hypothetical protein [Pelolinea sp.]
MEELLRFMATYEMGVYIIFGVIILINLKKLLDGWTGLRKANFGLEREVAQKKLRSAITIIALFLIFGISNFILVSVASIRYPGIANIATPTIDLVSTPIPSGANSEGVKATPETLQQTQTAIALTGCIPGQLEWIDPKDGAEVSGSVELKGTVNVPNLGFYKYEYRFQSVETWTPISAGNRPIVEELFAGRWNTGQLQPGNYSLRLVVSDNQNNLLKPCEIEVKVLPQ